MTLNVIAGCVRVLYERTSRMNMSYKGNALDWYAQYGLSTLERLSHSVAAQSTVSVRAAWRIDSSRAVVFSLSRKVKKLWYLASTGCGISEQ